MKDKRRGSRHLIKAIDPCLPLTFRESTNLSLEDLIRARVLVAIMLSAIVSTSVTIVVLFISQKLSRGDFSSPIIIASVTDVILILDYIFFYKSGRLDASAILFSLTFFLGVVISTILTGGFDSPVRIMLICTPIVAFLVGGRQEGIYNVALSFVVGMIFLVLKSYEFPMMQVMPENILTYMSGIVWTLALVLIIVCLYVYDVLLEDTRDTVAHMDSVNE